MWKATLMIMALSVSAVQAAEHCALSAEQQFTLQEVAQLKLSIAADQLRVIGSDRADVQVTAKLCASSQQRLDEMQIQHSQQADTTEITLLPKQRDNSSGIRFLGGLNKKYSRFELQLVVPHSLLLALEVGSGTAEVSNLQQLNLALGSGKVNAKSIKGVVEASVGSGAFTLTDAGAVQLKALGSGEAVLKNITGLYVYSVGSGDLNVSQVKGDARFASIGSGNVELADQQGDLQIASVGSGDAKISQLTGMLNIERIGSGSVSVADVNGDVHVGALGSGSIRVTQVTGDLRLAHKGSGDFQFKNIAGQVLLK